MEEDNKIVKEMVEEVVKEVSKADLEKAVKAAQDEVNAELQNGAPASCAQQQLPPVIGSIVIRKFLVGGQAVPNIQMEGVWSCGDLLDLSAQFQQAARAQQLGNVVPADTNKTG